jgi:hypothetical protein
MTIEGNDGNGNQCIVLMFLFVHSATHSVSHCCVGCPFAEFEVHVQYRIGLSEDFGFILFGVGEQKPNALRMHFALYTFLGNKTNEWKIDSVGFVDAVAARSISTLQLLEVFEFLTQLLKQQFLLIDCFLLLGNNILQLFRVDPLAVVG